VFGLPANDWQTGQCISEGPKGRPEGVNGSRLKYLQFEMIGLTPKFTPNPKVLGTVWSSYGGSTPTQESPRNKQDPTWKQPPKAARKTAKYISPVDPTHKGLSTSVKPMIQSLQ